MMHALIKCVRYGSENNNLGYIYTYTLGVFFTETWNWYSSI